MHDHIPTRVVTIFLDTIPACGGRTDRQTDRQTPHDSKDRAMQSVAPIKNELEA